MTSLLLLTVILSGPPAENAVETPHGYFRGVFKHKGRIKSIQIGYRSRENGGLLFTGKDDRVEGVRIHIEQGCFTYDASGYARDSQVLLLPVSIYLGAELDAERREQLGEEYLKELEEKDLLTFDIASVICHLDERREIERVDIVLPDLTIYHVERNHKTASDP